MGRSATLYFSASLPLHPVALLYSPPACQEVGLQTRACIAACPKVGQILHVTLDVSSKDRLLLLRPDSVMPLLKPFVYMPVSREIAWRQYQLRFKGMLVMHKVCSACISCSVHHV